MDSLYSRDQQKMAGSSTERLKEIIMSESENQLILEGLTALQMAELKSAISSMDHPTVSERATPSLPSGMHGEPVTISVVITVTPVVIAAVAMWLAKQKSRRTERFRFESVTPNGAKTIIEFDRFAYNEGESAAPAIESFFKEALYAVSE
jgi:hypothetical protein